MRRSNLQLAIWGLLRFARNDTQGLFALFAFRRQLREPRFADEIEVRLMIFDVVNVLVKVRLRAFGSLARVNPFAIDRVVPVVKVRHFTGCEPNGAGTTASTR